MRSVSERWQTLGSVLLVAAVLAALAPALDIYIAGDDFEWLSHSYGVLDHPWTSFELNNNFFRPLIKWTYVVDYLISGTGGLAYVLTNLVIHVCNSAMLFVLMRRRIRVPIVAAASAAAFALSPLHSEGFLWAAGRPDSLLLTCWLAALLLLDRWCDRPTALRAILFTFAGLVGIGVKESWIVFPALAAGFVIVVRSELLATAVRRTAVLWFAWIGYVLGFLVLPALRGTAVATHYADFGIPQAAAKTALTLLGYLGLGWMPLSGMSAVALATLVVAATMAVLWRTGNRFGWWALLWLAATLAITAPFPMSVLRHNYIALAGFWMVAASLMDRLLAPSDDSLILSHRRPIAVAVAAAVSIVLVLQGLALQQEISDYRRYGELHRLLVESFAAVEPEIDRQLPLVFIDRGTLRGVELMSRSVEGVPKTFFVRRDALWQLVFLPQLADFVGRPFVERLRAADPTVAIERNRCTVLVFEDRGFTIRDDLEGRVIETLAQDSPPENWSVYRYVGVK